MQTIETKTVGTKKYSLKHRGNLYVISELNLDTGEGRVAQDFTGNLKDSMSAEEKELTMEMVEKMARAAFESIGK